MIVATEPTYIIRARAIIVIRKRQGKSSAEFNLYDVARIKFVPSCGAIVRASWNNPVIVIIVIIVICIKINIVYVPVRLAIFSRIILLGKNGLTRLQPNWRVC